MSKSTPDDPDPDAPPEPSFDNGFPPAPAEPSFAFPLGGPVSGGSVFVDVDDVAPAEPLLQPQVPQPPTLDEVLTIGGSQYRLVRRLGHGGQAEVFLARKLGAAGFERSVALKTILPHLPAHRTEGPAHLKAFVDEARLAAQLQHSNICQVLDLQLVEGRGLIQILEYIPGRSLNHIIDIARRKRRALTEAFAAYVASEVAAALDYAHSAPTRMLQAAREVPTR